MEDGNEDVRELFATARAIHFAYQQGAISLQQAKDKTKPLLLIINKVVTQIAKECKVKPQYITFTDLGRSI